MGTFRIAVVRRLFTRRQRPGARRAAPESLGGRRRSRHVLAGRGRRARPVRGDSGSRPTLGFVGYIGVSRALVALARVYRYDASLALPRITPRTPNESSLKRELFFFYRLKTRPLSRFDASALAREMPSNLWVGARVRVGRRRLKKNRENRGERHRTSRRTSGPRLRLLRRVLRPPGRDSRVIRAPTLRSDTAQILYAPASAAHVLTRADRPAQLDSSKLVADSGQFLCPPKREATPAHKPRRPARRPTDPTLRSPRARVVRRTSREGRRYQTSRAAGTRTGALCRGAHAYPTVTGAARTAPHPLAPRERASS